MKTLSGLLLAAALFAITGAASASDKVDVIVVTAKKPAATMLTDMDGRDLRRDGRRASLATVEAAGDRRARAFTSRSRRSAPGTVELGARGRQRARRAR